VAASITLVRTSGIAAKRYGRAASAL